MMKKISCAVVAVVAACVLVSAQTADVQKVLGEIKAKDKGLLAVSEEDGRFLRLMVATRKAQRALEIGGASGYSAIWIGLGLRDTGGRLVTIEYDPVRAKELADNIKRAGLSDIVQVIGEYVSLKRSGVNHKGLCPFHREGRSLAATGRTLPAGVGDAARCRCTRMVGHKACERVTGDIGLFAIRPL